MRLLAATALFATFVSIANLQAQSLAEHGAAAAGATIGTAAGKPISNAVTKIFGQVDDQAKSASKTDVKVVRPASPGEKPSPAGPAATATGGAQTLPAGPGPAPAAAGAGSPGGTTDELTEPASAARRARAESRRAATRLRRQRESAASESAASLPAPIAAPVPVEPAVKEPTPEEVAGIQIGASEKDVVDALGVPASRVIIPDDDGHLRESYQYWAKGSQIGTVRLDNGYVVKIEARRF
jgi:hypothetical protein